MGGRSPKSQTLSWSGASTVPCLAQSKLVESAKVKRPALEGAGEKLRLERRDPPSGSHEPSFRADHFTCQATPRFTRYGDTDFYEEHGVKSCRARTARACARPDRASLT